MTEQHDKLAALFSACWRDEAVKARFHADPKAVLAEYGIPVPDGLTVKVVENADDCVHITLPSPPPEGANISDADLTDAAGGGTNATSVCCPVHSICYTGLHCTC